LLKCNDTNGMERKNFAHWYLFNWNSMVKRALVNIRKAKPISNEFLEIEDRYLENKLEKHITKEGIYLQSPSFVVLYKG